MDGGSTRVASQCFFLPDEPLESSETVDPERSGTSAEAMVLLVVVVVRGCIDMVRTPARSCKLEQCWLCAQKKIGSVPRWWKCAEMVSKRQAWAPKSTAMPTYLRDRRRR